MPQKVLVAGASGHLGRAIVAELKHQGYTVRALGRSKARLSASGADEVFEADLTREPSLSGACTGIDAVISCAGAVMDINQWKEKQTFHQVDYQGNCNLLAEARRAGVNRVIYVSLAAGEKLRSTAYADAHERFVEALKVSGLVFTIVRPTGFFSFLLEVLNFARQGTGLLIGDGSCRTNPIDDTDVARACVAALTDQLEEIEVGGPTVFSRREITELAFTVLGKKPRLITLRPGIFKLLIWPLKFINRRIYELMEFGIAVSLMDVVAQPYGKHELRDYFELKKSS